MRISSLDGLRAISFLIVFTGHAGMHQHPGLGVTIFFFLSGYLITTLLRLEYDQHQSINLKNFYLRRVLRIWPPFYIVLALAVALAMIDGQVFSWRGVLAIGAHVSNYWQIEYGQGTLPDGTGVFWSLAVEEHFYLLFPLLYIGLRRLGIEQRDQAIILLGLCALVLLWRFLAIYTMHWMPERNSLATDTRIDSILFGCVLAVWGNPAMDKPVVPPWLWPLGVLAIIGAEAVHRQKFDETLRYSIEGMALIPIFVAATQMKGGLLNWRWLAFIGTLSYSLYLVHLVVMLRTGPVAGFAISIAIAFGLYVAVERPCANLRKRLRSS